MKTKYTSEILLDAFRKCASLRNELIALGFTDNGGAIHSAERVLELLCVRHKYGLTHINDLKKSSGAERTSGAREAIELGESIRIEHIHPIREWTKLLINKVTDGETNEELLNYIMVHYRLVLISKKEAQHLDSINRSRITERRLEDAGILLHALDENINKEGRDEHSR